MAEIKKYLSNIKNAVFGKDVRGSIHDGIDAINKEVESTTKRQDNLEKVHQQLIINAGDSNAEVVDARVDKTTGQSFETMGERLDAATEQFIKTDQKLNENDARLSKIDNSINYVNQRVSNRNFKPNFGVSAYWGEASDDSGNCYNAVREKMINDINIWEDHCCDEIVVPIHISYNKLIKKIYIVENLEDISYIIEYCENLNIKVSVIKVHVQKINQSTVVDHGIEDFKYQYKLLLEELAILFKNTSVKIMTVLNEVGWIYESDEHESFSNECLNIAKKHGYLTGVTCAGFGNFYNIKKSVIENSDKIFINTYPRVSSKKEKTELNDVLNGWNSNNDVLHIKKIKTIYPNKNIIISECGVQDYWIALSCPENYKWDEKDKILTNGQAPSIYLTGLIKTFNDSGVEAVWWWYDLKWDITKKITNYYLKGVVNND